MRRDVGDMNSGRLQKASGLAMRSEQRTNFFQQSGIGAALLAQEVLLPLGRHSQRRLQQFIYAFKTFSIHQEIHGSSREP